MPSLTHTRPARPADDTARPDLWDLVDQARSGDDRAFGELLAATVGTVYPFVSRRVLGDRETTEEITTDVYCSAWRALDRVQPSASSPVAWLVTIAKRRIIDHHRSRRRTSFAAGTAEDVASYRAAAPSAAPSAERICLERLDRAEECAHARTVWEYARQLPRPQYEVLLLRYWFGLSIADTAARMGKPTTAVKTLQLRAKNGLRELLDGSDLDPRCTTTTAAAAA